VKLTSKLLEKLIKEEVRRLKEVNPLGGDYETAAVPADEQETVAPNPLGGDHETAAMPADERETVVPNPLGGDHETAAAPQGIPLGQRVSNIEKILKQLVARIK